MSLCSSCGLDKNIRSTQKHLVSTYDFRFHASQCGNKCKNSPSLPYCLRLIIIDAVTCAVELSLEIIDSRQLHLTTDSYSRSKVNSIGLVQRQNILAVSYRIGLTSNTATPVALFGKGCSGGATVLGNF